MANFQSHVLQQLRAATNMFRFREHGFQELNKDADSFFLSFWCIALGLPAFLVSTAQNAAMSEEATRWFPLLTVYVVSWLAIPIIAFFLFKMLELTRHYAVTVILINWMSLVAFYVMAIVSLLLASFSVNVAAPAFIAVLLFVLWNRFHFLRMALDGRGDIATLVIIIDTTSGMLLASLSA